MLRHWHHQHDRRGKSAIVTTTTMPMLLMWLLASVKIFSDAAPIDDMVTILPDHGVPPTPNYSGYLDATSTACNATFNGPVCKLHYWFVRAAVPDPDGAPVVLWLNGGPGSSSLLGLLEENGPLLKHSIKPGFFRNPWSWTRVANVLYLESPFGVGYSYCSKQLEPEGEPCYNDDDTTAVVNRAALVDFFKNKFPELARNDFFITGESYAGVYIPTLAKEILDNPEDKINLVGLAVGDPCTDFDAQKDASDALWYGHKYGFVPDQDYDYLWNTCGVRAADLIRLSSGPAGGDLPDAPPPSVRRGRFTEEVGRRLVEELDGIDSLSDVRDWTDDGLKSKLRSIVRDLVQQGYHVRNRGKKGRQRRRLQQHYEVENAKTSSSSSDEWIEWPDLTFKNTACKIAYRKFLLSTSNGFSQLWQNGWIDDYTLYQSGGLHDQDDSVRAYLLRPDVREALHLTEYNPTDWPNPPGDTDDGLLFDYETIYNACNDEYIPDAPSMLQFYRDISPRLPGGVVIFNGDADPCVTYEGTRTAVTRIGFAEMDGGSYRPWFYDHAASDVLTILDKAPLFGPDLLTKPTGTQFGGHVLNYEHGLTFMTFHGAGHMVPEFRPQASLHVLIKLLRREPFSPPYPSNATLGNLTDDEFDDVLDKWTVSAKSSPYVMKFELGDVEPHEASTLLKTLYGGTLVDRDGEVVPKAAPVLQQASAAGGGSDGTVTSGIAPRRETAKAATRPSVWWVALLSSVGGMLVVAVVVAVGSRRSLGGNGFGVGGGYAWSPIPDADLGTSTARGGMD